MPAYHVEFKMARDFNTYTYDAVGFINVVLSLADYSAMIGGTVTDVTLFEVA